MKGEKKIKHHRELSQGLPTIENNAVTQTIIINNPNFNINYIENSIYNPKSNRDANSRTIHDIPCYDGKNSSKGIDAWNLNRNLKEFSETRQVKFFEGNVAKTRSNSQLHNSPYLIHKTKTYEIKPYSKINPANVNSFRQNKTIAAIKNQAVIKSARQNSNLSLNKPSLGTLEANDESKATFRKRKFDSKSKNSKPIISDSSFQSYLNKTLKINQTIANNGSKTERVQKKANQSRRNKFIEIDQIQAKVNKLQNQQNSQNMDDIQNQLVMNQLSPKKNIKNEYVDKQIKNNRKFEKSIQKISKCLLSKVNNYFDQPQSTSITSTKIQVYTATAHHPISYSHSMDYKSSSNDISPGCYDFKFEGENPNRPKTPYKRKKMYEEA